MAFGTLAAGTVALAGSRLKYLTKIQTVKIDNWIFSLHYRLTLILLLAFSFLVGSNQFFGSSIDCIVSTDVPRKVINEFCWVEGTFTLPRALVNAIRQDEHQIPHPGVDKFVAGRDETIEHKYYQWVSMVLFLQALCFYLTRALWKKWEGGKLRNIIQDMNKVILKATELSKKESFLVKYLLDNRGGFNAYAFRFLICEILNFVNIILQMLIINSFLGGAFADYGFEVLSFPGTLPTERSDPMDKIFPKMTKCSFSAFGPSGSVQKYDNLCILPLNIVNEKIYIFLWFWLMLLGTMSGVAVMSRIMVIAFPRSRYYLLRGFNRIVPERYFATIVSRCSYGDWFLLYLLSVNLDPLHYFDVVVQFSDHVEMEPLNGRSEVDMESRRREEDKRREAEKADTATPSGSQVSV